MKFLNEHVSSRKEWGRYVELASEVHRSVAAEADEFLAQLRDRLELVMRRNGSR